MTLNKSSSALARFTVIDLTQARSGPTCVRQFCDWGANVIAIERPEPPPQSGAQPLDYPKRHDPEFQNLFRNRRSLVLDIKTAQGLAVLKRLAQSADVLVENYRPDVKHRLGIDYESMRKINPRLVYTSISGFGQEGPYRERPGVDQIAQGMSGLMSVTGEAGRGPLRVGIPIADITTGIFAALGTMTALLEREVSGEGQWVQTSLLETQIFMMDLQASRWLMKGLPAEQLGNGHPNGVPTGCYPTQDGYVNIAMLPRMWPRFCKAMGLDSLLDDPDFATIKARVRNRARVDEIIVNLVRQRESSHWVKILNEAGVPCGPIYTIDQVFADEQVHFLGMVQDVASATAGPLRLLGQPVTLSRTPSRLTKGASELGEHSEEILAEAGYTTGEIAKLRTQGILG